MTYLSLGLVIWNNVEQVNVKRLDSISVWFPVSTFRRPGYGRSAFAEALGGGLRFQTEDRWD